MNVLILGCGAREHAFAWKLRQSKNCGKLYVAPGNVGTSQVAQNLDVNPNDFNAVRDIVIKKRIDFVLVGTEEPLVLGIVDFFRQDKTLSDVKIFGPSRKGAMLEGSKDFAKDFMAKYQIPTAEHKTFHKDNLHRAEWFLDYIKAPYVLKADGLAAGKGVLIINDKQEALKMLREMILDKKFGEASSKVVVEEFLDGIEFSVFVVTDGNRYLVLPEAKDYKRVGDGDTGLNTGGMGAVSPVSFMTAPLLKKVNEYIIKPTIEGIRKEEIDYTGFIFFGLIKIENDVKVIEYNVRMGDPETQVVLPRMKSDFLEILVDFASKGNRRFLIKKPKQVCTTVVMTSGGYPLEYEKEKTITGLEQNTDSIVFHAGTKYDNGKLVTNGGRVLSVTSLGDNLERAIEKSYKTIENIKFDGEYFRSDIGKDLM